MESKTIQKYQNRNKHWLEKKAVEYFNKYIRLRDCDDNGFACCISCGKPMKYGSKYHAGHFYSAGKYPSIKFNEDNVHAQCLQCNYYGHSEGNLYRINLEKKIGLERLKTLDTLAGVYKQTHKSDTSRFYFIEIIEKYKQKCKELAKEKMFKV